MSLEYRNITLSDTEPTNPEMCDIWIKQVDDSYQSYIYINSIWNPMLSGGIYAAETDPDDHYFNIYIQNFMPTIIKNGWFWFKQNTGQLYIYLNGFVPFYEV